MQVFKCEKAEWKKNKQWLSAHTSQAFDRIEPVDLKIQTK